MATAGVAAVAAAAQAEVAAASGWAAERVVATEGGAARTATAFALVATEEAAMKAAMKAVVAAAVLYPVKAEASPASARLAGRVAKARIAALARTAETVASPPTERPLGTREGARPSP